MGQVFKARDTRLRRLVAIKQSATQFGDRFEREARSVAALNHPNICQVYDVGPDYFVMELLEGRPLAPVEGTRKVLDLAVQIADGMAAAHAAEIVHRDLKPDNILVAPNGRVKILDFGVAQAIAGDPGGQVTRATLTGTVVGTVHYMSPEQARGQAALGPQSDQFSFGLILYELVTGKKAFVRESSAETLTAIIREDAPPLPASGAGAAAMDYRTPAREGSGRPLRLFSRSVPRAEAPAGSAVRCDGVQCDDGGARRASLKAPGRVAPRGPDGVGWRWRRQRTDLGVGFSQRRGS